jgi:HD-GYP domain-containing protein (c-di-GMP phosphodiesterase class II)
MSREIKTSVEGLRVGMFVSRLDRPWIGTPFELEGFSILDRADIQRLSQHCNYVYVDPLLGPSPEPGYRVAEDEQPPAPKSSAETEEFKALRATLYEDTQPLEVELATASNVSQQLSNTYEGLVADLQQNRDIDLNQVRSGVSDMVDSLLRNPSAMMWMVELKRTDGYSYSRALGSSVWCATFGRHLGLEPAAVNQLALGGLLLDIGKTRLPPELLTKGQPLDAKERRLVHHHVNLGVRLLALESQKRPDSNIEMEVLQMIATHHERADGSGYPQGLTNERIPLYGRIAGLVDSFDAITSLRPYVHGGPRSAHEAISELYSLRGSRFQAELVEQFIQAVGLYPTGSLVELSSGEVGAVVAVNGLRRLRPKLMMILDANKQPYAEFHYLDLSTESLDLRISRGLAPGAYGIDMHEFFL